MNDRALDNYKRKPEHNRADSGKEVTDIDLEHTKIQQADKDAERNRRHINRIDLHNITNRMVQSSFHVTVEPSVLTYLRQSAGYSREEVGKLLNVTEDLIFRWESGTSKPTYNELKKIAEAFRRPLAAFFLPQPPQEPKLPRDYRRLPNHQNRLSRNTLFIIRKAQDLQRISRELLENIGSDINPLSISVDIGEKPDFVAIQERGKFDVPVKVQKEMDNAHELFRTLVNIIESNNIRVFQFSIDVNELRGFALVDEKPYVIVVSSSDPIQARVFTLMHEYGHILLRESALCNPENISYDTSHESIVERWCNNFAGSFLLPEEDVRKDVKSTDMKGITRVANKYKVSKSALLTRSLHLRMIAPETYAELMGILSKGEKKPEDESGGGGESAARKVVRERGKTFVSLVMQNVERGHITNSRALDFLDVKLNHLAELSNK